MSPPPSSSRPTRRMVLSGGAAGLVASTLPGCREGGSSDSGSVTPGQIDHVIVVMMENRSFDHYLGALRMEGREVDGLTGQESNPDTSGAPVTVYHLDVHCQEDPPHGWDSSHSQFNEGANDGFVLEHAEGDDDAIAGEVMGYYTREDLPVHYALADTFAVPERYFSSVMGPTWPNRFYGHAGTSDGQSNNDWPEQGAFTFKTVYKALEEAGLDWRYVYTDIPFIGLFADHWDDQKIFMLEDFFREIERGDLAPFNWIDPGFSYNDDHPPHHPGLGQMFLALIYEALARSPVWDRCLLVITYDEHGGFYDHVPPPQTEDDFADLGFDQLGFRIPTLVVGPWVKQGVDSTVFDHASVLKYVCERFGLTPWTKRIEAANSLSALLDEERMASGEALEPAILPAFEVPASELVEECFPGVALSLGPHSSNQPELEDFVRATRPGSLRLDEIPAIHRRLRALADEWGLIRR